MPPRHRCLRARLTTAAVLGLVAASAPACHHRGSDKPLDEGTIPLSARQGSRTGSVLERDQMNPTASSFMELIQGRLPGVLLRQRGANVSVEIRGPGSIRGSNEALIVIDGVENTGRVLASINPSDVERVEVLKDGSAAIYGLRGANGVLLITTRRR